MYLPSLDPKKTGKKLLEGIKEPLVLFIYTKYRHGKGLHIPKCFLSQKCKNV